MRALVGSMASAALVAACSVGLPDRADNTAGKPTTTNSGETGQPVVSAPPAADGGVTPAPVTPTPPATDAGTPTPPPPPACAPKTFSGFDVTPWQPPQTLHKNACSEQQIQTIVECLFTSVPTTQQCDQFWSSYQNDACLTCAITSSLAPKAGPIIDDGSYYWTNPSGCMSALQGDSTAASCGAKFSVLADCEWAACGYCADNDWDACVAAARTGICAPYATAPACASVQSSCTSNISTVDEAQKILKLFCRP